MKHVNNQSDRGSIYITVIIILAVVLMLLSMLVVITGREMRSSHLYSEGIRAYYIAHSGVTKGIAYAKEDPQVSKPEVSEGPGDNVFQTYYPAYHSLSWRVDYNPEEKDYTIVAVGSYRYNSNITVKRMLEVKVRVREGVVEVDSWAQKYD